MWKKHKRLEDELWRKANGASGDDASSTPKLDASLPTSPLRCHNLGVRGKG